MHTYARYMSQECGTMPVLGISCNALWRRAESLDLSQAINTAQMSTAVYFFVLALSP